jgi:hypothetical protein
MRRPCTAVVLFIAIGIFLPLVGCQKNSSPSSSASQARQSRLTADENLRLKGQMKDLESQLAAVTKDLQQCTQERAQAEEEAGKNLSFIMEQDKKETQQLQDENEKLKVQIQKLEDELKQKKN